MVICEYCDKPFNVSEGAWDNGNYMCPDCIAGYIEKSERNQRNQQRKLKLSGKSEASERRNPEDA